MKKTLALLLSVCMLLAVCAGCAQDEEIEAVNATIAEIDEALTGFNAAFDEYIAAQAAEQAEADSQYEVIPVTMTMQAGYQEYHAYDGGGVMTIHAGIGYIDPLGEGHYYAGIMYPESFANDEAIYVSDWMDANFGCSLFCIYSLPDGDIYAWDGIYGANARDMANFMEGEDGYTADEVNGSVPTRSDVLINIVVGGTGAYRGATGVLIGSTSGGGVYDTRDGMTLPQTLFKLMEGYIRIPSADTSYASDEATATHTVTQAFTDDRSALEVTGTDYAMVDVELRLQSGALEEDNAAGSGVGTFLPYNSNALTTDSGNDQEAAADYPVENYFNDNWLDVYGDPTFMTYHIDDGYVAGDLYGWQFAYGTIGEGPTGDQEALFTLIVGGTGDFENVTGILGGHSVTCDPDGWGDDNYGNDEPLCNMTLMKGSLKVPSSSYAAEYGNETID